MKAFLFVLDHIRQTYGDLAVLNLLNCHRATSVVTSDTDEYHLKGICYVTH